MSNEQLIFERNTQGKTLMDERDSLSLVHRKLRREIANGKIAGKGQAWLDAKLVKLSNVALAWHEVEQLIESGRVTRHRAQGRCGQGLGTKNFLHFSA